MSAAARAALGACGAGLGLACGAGLAAHAAESAIVLPLQASGKADKLTPGQAIVPQTTGGQITTSQTVPPQAIPVDTVVARAVSKDAPAQPPPPPPPQTKTAGSGPGGYLPPSPLPKTHGQPTQPAPAATEDAPGEIQWSSKKGAPGAPAAKQGRVELTVPLRDGTFYLGDVPARIAGDAVSVPKDRLLQVLAPLLRPQALEAIKNLPAPDGYVPLAALKTAGFDIQFDPGKVEMQINPAIEQRATGRLNMGRGHNTVMSENLSRPAIFAGYLNMRAGADYATQTFYGDEGSANARIGFDGALTWLDVVFESAATFDMDGGFSRGSSRFVYDMPDKALRISAGDISPMKSTFQGGSDILGVSIEKSYQKLQPATSIHPTGSQSFRIERPSNVDVVVNGHVAQKLHLRPGDYDMSDLPLSAGANDITLIIEDDLGQRRTLNFSVFSGRSLLAPGIAEWGLSAGVASRYNSTGLRGMDNLYSGLEYDFTIPVVTGFYERGLTPDVTGSMHVQADPGVVMGGAGVAFQTRFGFWVIDGAVSDSFTYGFGYASNFGYELVNLEGGDGIRRSIRLAVDYRSENFATVNVLEPCNDTMLGFLAAYSQELPWDLSGSISGSYSIGYGDHGDRYGVDVSLARSFGPFLSAGLSLGYEHSTEPRTETGVATGFKAAVRLTYRIDENSSIDANHDARYGQSQVSYRHQEGTGVGSWNAQVELDRSASDGDGDPDHYGVNGSLGYTANRAELAVSQHTGLAGLNTSSVEQRTSVTAGTAIAFADGHAALGRPISNGFAIVTPHSNLPESQVAIGSSQDSQRAVTDLLGPALLPDVSPYSPSRIPIDVNNLPPGYDLGAGAFDLFPGYKSGYALTVGSDYTVSAYGTLVDADGQPIPLLTGTAYEEGHQNDHTVTVFTNRAGKFGAQGLRPGRWILDMATEPKSRFVIDIPKDTVGLFKAGTLKPVGGAR